ncbi:MAG: hypothetical protein ACQER6_09870 [Pseudomonadota bacterium]
MAKYRAEKVVSSLPDPLEPDTVYYVRTGDGFDMYVSDATGSVAHALNLPEESGGGGGDIVLLQTVEITSPVAAVDITGLDLSEFGYVKVEYDLYINSGLDETFNFIVLQSSDDNGVTFATTDYYTDVAYLKNATGYDWSKTNRDTKGAVLGATFGHSASFQLSRGVLVLQPQSNYFLERASQYTLSGIHGYPNSKSWAFEAAGNNPNDSISMTNSAYRILYDAGDLVAGTIKVYGVK